MIDTSFANPSIVVLASLPQDGGWPRPTHDMLLSHRRPTGRSRLPNEVCSFLLDSPSRPLSNRCCGDSRYNTFNNSSLTGRTRHSPLHSLRLTQHSLNKGNSYILGPLPFCCCFLITVTVTECSHLSGPLLHTNVFTYNPSFSSFLFSRSSSYSSSHNTLISLFCFLLLLQLWVSHTHSCI